MPRVKRKPPEGLVARTMYEILLLPIRLFVWFAIAMNHVPDAVESLAFARLSTGHRGGRVAVIVARAAGAVWSAILALAGASLLTRPFTQVGPLGLADGAGGLAWPLSILLVLISFRMILPLAAVLWTLGERGYFSTPVRLRPRDTGRVSDAEAPQTREDWSEQSRKDERGGALLYHHMVQPFLLLGIAASMCLLHLVAAAGHLTDLFIGIAMVLVATWFWG